MVRLMLAILGCILPAAAYGAPATIMCATFMGELDDAIEAGGSRTPFPVNFKVAFQERGNPFVRYSFSGIDGLRGDLNCLTNDHFRNLYIEALLDGKSDKENQERIDRVEALASAAICATEHWSPAQCDRAISALSKTSHDEYFSVRDDRRSIAHGDGHEDLPSGAQADASLAQGSFVFILHSPRPKN